MVTLTISGPDFVASGVKRLHFAPARFSPGETAILSAVGPLAVSWDLGAAKRGKSVYTVKRLHANIIDTDTVASDPSAVVAMFAGGVGLAARRKRCF